MADSKSDPQAKKSIIIAADDGNLYHLSSDDLQAHKMDVESSGSRPRQARSPPTSSTGRSPRSTSRRRARARRSTARSGSPGRTRTRSTCPRSRTAARRAPQGPILASGVDLSPGVEGSTPKAFLAGTHRLVPPEATVARVPSCCP